MTMIYQFLRRNIHFWSQNNNVNASTSIIKKVVVQQCHNNNYYYQRPLLYMTGSGGCTMMGILSHNENDSNCPINTTTTAISDNNNQRQQSHITTTIKSYRTPLQCNMDMFGMMITSWLQQSLHKNHIYNYLTNTNNYNNHHHRHTYCESVTTSTSTTTKSPSSVQWESEQGSPSPPPADINHPTTTKKSKIQRQMTSIGRFALVSETKYNPSIITFVLQLENNRQNDAPNNNNKNYKQLTANDLIRIWSLKQMPQRHPRFHQIIHDTNHQGVTAKSSSSSSVSFHPEIMTDISQHISESILPCNRYELQRIIGTMQLSQWDLSDSLWQITICNNNITNSIMSTLSPMMMQSNTRIPTTFLTHVTDGTDPTSIDSNTTSNKRLPPTLLLFRGHHVLADGASMAAAFMDIFDEAEWLQNQIITAVQQYRLRRQKRKKNSVWFWLWRKWVQWVQLCYGTMKSFTHMIRLVYYQLFIDHNPWKVIQQQNKMDDKENATTMRIVSWSDVASVEQVKWVADTLSDDGKNKKKSSFKITVNDVFIACVTAAMSKQLQFHRQRIQELSFNNTTKKQKRKENTKVLDEQKFIHVAVPVHLKGGVVLPNESVSNCIGALVARVPCEMSDDEGQEDSHSITNRSVERLQAVSSELHTIKRTPTAVISFIMAKVLSNVTTWNILPSSWMSYLYANANAGSMVVVSNNRGPSIPVHIDGHKVESITGFVPLPPGIPVGVVVMSYAGRMNCALSAEPWAVPDGDQFMLWVLEEYLQLVNAAKMKQSQQNGSQ